MSRPKKCLELPDWRGHLAEGAPCLPQPGMVTKNGVSIAFQAIRTASSTFAHLRAPSSVSSFSGVFTRLAALANPIEFLYPCRTEPPLSETGPGAEARAHHIRSSGTWKSA